MSSSSRSLPRAAWVYVAILLLTTIQLAIGAFGGLSQFADKGFGYRLVVYPVLMLLVPAIWWLRHRQALLRDLPWIAFSLIGAPFLIDVSGNTVGLYDSVDVWDNVNHFFNWALLLGGIGMLIARLEVRPRWVLVAVITGLGSILAVVWEIGEWWTFIRRGTELDGAYEDTLSDELLGTLGALAAALVVERVSRRKHV
ncbi:MAG: hypothetical protein ABI360_04690 [Allobranchiibius sp.]